jgi:hypothetical protein
VCKWQFFVLCRTCNSSGKNAPEPGETFHKYTFCFQLDIEKLPKKQQKGKAARRLADKHLLGRIATKNFTRQEVTAENQGKPPLVQNKAHQNTHFTAAILKFARRREVPKYN